MIISGEAEVRPVSEIQCKSFYCERCCPLAAGTPFSQLFAELRINTEAADLEVTPSGRYHLVCIAVQAL